MPKLRYHWSIGLSILGVGLWAGVTFGAEPLLPVVLRVIDWVEVTFELDHARVAPSKS